MKVAMMTSGGLAPCLSASVAQLVRYWAAALKEGKIASLSIRMYLDGYKGILIGDSFLLDEALWEECDALNYLGGSPIGNSRVKVCILWFASLLVGLFCWLIGLFALLSSMHT